MARRQKIQRVKKYDSSDLSNALSGKVFLNLAGQTMLKTDAELLAAYKNDAAFRAAVMREMSWYNGEVPPEKRIERPGIEARL